MKHLRLIIILIAILSIGLVAEVYAAVIDTTSPYSGDYLLAINTSTDDTTTQYSGNMTMDNTNINLLQLTMDNINPVPNNPDVVDIREENGLKMEQIDPRNKLASMKKTQNIITNQSNLLSYSDLYAVTYTVGSQRTFSTADFRYSPPSTVYKTFTLKYSGSKCNIWLENGSTVSLTDANITSLGSEFDNNIYTNMTSNFGTGYDRDGDGKTAIMLYDIQDGWNGTTQTGYYGGFFDSGELIGYENNMDVIHIDTYPTMGQNKSYPDITRAYNTFAHEYQHFINFSYSYTYGKATMPVWLNEGLSMAAEHMLYGELSSRITYYNTSTYIRDGHSVFYWDQNGNVLSNYSLSYLFVQYLACQTKGYSGGGTAIYKTIIQSNNRTSTVIQDVMRQFFSTITLDTIQSNFRIATLLLEPSGPYGFGNNAAFSNVKPLLYSGSGLYLRGGGAVIKAIPSAVTPSGYGANVKFLGFKRDKVATPVANPASGTVVSGTQVSLSCATTDASLYYTLDGSTPNSNSSIYYSSPITITANTTIKVMAHNQYMIDSDVATYTYSLIQKVAVPTANPASGAVAGGTQVSLSSTTSGATIRFTSDGTMPTSTIGTVYSTPITVSANITIKAIAYKSGMTDSNVATFSYTTLNANPTQIAWKTRSGNGGNDEGYSSLAVANDGYVAVGYSSSFGCPSKGLRDAVIIKYDLDRNVLWKSTFGGSGNDEFYSVVVKDDYYVAVGYSASFNSGDWVGITGKGYNDAIIVKYNISGNVVWKKNFGSSSYDRFKSVYAVSDGYIAVGYSNAFRTGDWIGVEGKGTDDGIIVKFDFKGNVVWKKNFGGSGVDEFNVVCAASDGYLVAGDSYVQSFGTGDFSEISGKGGTDAIVVKYDFNGNVVWKKNFGSSSTDVFRSVISEDDGYVLVGNSYIENNGDWVNVSSRGDYDAIIVKIDINGNVVWKKSFGGSSSDAFSSLDKINGGYIAVGSAISFGNGDLVNLTSKGGTDAIVVKFDYYGNFIWKSAFGGSGDDDFKCIKPVIGDFIVVGGAGSSYNSGDLSDVSGYGACIMVKYNYPPLYIPCLSYGIYRGTNQLYQFPTTNETFTIKSQYQNTSGENLNTTFIITVKSNNKLINTYVIPKSMGIAEIVDISQDINLPSATSAPNLKIKIFALDNLSTLYPVSSPVIMAR